MIFLNALLYPLVMISIYAWSDGKIRKYGNRWNLHTFFFFMFSIVGTMLSIFCLVIPQ